MRRRQTMSGWRGGVKSPAAPVLCKECNATPDDPECICEERKHHQRPTIGPDPKPQHEGIESL